MNDQRISRRNFALGVTAIAGTGLAMPMLSRRALAAPVALRMSSSLPSDPNSAHWVWYDQFAKNLKSKVGDQVTVNYFPDNQLGKESDIVGQVKLGIVDMMISGSSIWATVAPEVGVLDLGFLFPTLEASGTKLDGMAGQHLNKIFADKAGVEVLAWGVSFGGRNVTARAPAPGPAELKGMKIRVLPVPNFVATLKAMGAAPTPMSLGEVYTGLQTGVIDGAEHDAPTVLALKWYEVAKQITLTKHIYNPQTAIISQRALKKIPPELQGPFKEAANEATKYQRGKAAEIETAAFATLKNNGITTIEADRAAYKALVMPVWDEFTKQYPNTKPILDAIGQV